MYNKEYICYKIDSLVIYKKIYKYIYIYIYIYIYRECNQ